MNIAVHLIYASVAIFITTSVVFLTYFISRHFFGRFTSNRGSGTHGSKLGIVAFLHGLVLTFFFAEQINYYHFMNKNTVEGSSALHDLYSTVELSTNPKKSKFQVLIKEYTKTIIYDEWNELSSSGELLDHTHYLLIAMRQIAIEPYSTNLREVELGSSSLEQLSTISQARYKRAHREERELRIIFWIAAMFGLVFISLGFCNERFTRETGLTLFLISSYTGLILSLNWSLSNLYSDPAIIKPVAYIRILEQMESYSPCLEQSKEECNILQRS